MGDDVVLEQANEGHRELLANLLELYVHDLSDVFPHLMLGPDGRYGYAKLEAYFDEPDRHFAFVIRREGGPAGFALVTRGSPAVDDPTVLDMAEFFGGPGLGGRGFGRRAAFLLWGGMPGRWVVRGAAANARALPFWTAVIGEFSAGRARRFERVTPTGPWHVFSFESGHGSSRT